MKKLIIVQKDQNALAALARRQGIAPTQVTVFLDHIKHDLAKTDLFISFLETFVFKSVQGRDIERLHTIFKRIRTRHAKLKEKWPQECIYHTPPELAAVLELLKRALCQHETTRITAQPGTNGEYLCTVDVENTIPEAQSQVPFKIEGVLVVPLSINHDSLASKTSN